MSQSGADENIASTVCVPIKIHTYENETIIYNNSNIVKKTYFHSELKLKEKNENNDI